MIDAGILVGKVAAPLAAKAAAGGLQWATLNLQVAWRARKQCQKRGLPVPTIKLLRRFLGDARVADIFVSGSPERLSELAATLRAATLGPHWICTGAESEQMVAILLSAYTRSLPNTQANEMQTRTAVAELMAYYRARDARSSEAEFDAALACMSRPRAVLAQELVRTWPPLGRFVLEYAAAVDRKQALEDWAQNRPAWLRDAPTPVILWIAGLAEDNGLVAVSAHLIQEAVTAGTTPAAYWRLRHVLLTTGETAALQVAALEPYAATHPVADALLQFLNGDPETALQHLGEWNPSAPSDAAFKAFIAVQLHVALGDYDSAMRLAEDGMTQGRTAAAQFVADRLLERGGARTSPLHFAQLKSSRDLALRVRDSLRTWNGPSRAAVITAIKAAEALGDGDYAWALTQVAPGGEATVGEAEGADVKARALMLAAELRPLDEAKALLVSAPDTLETVQARALIAERSSDDDQAIALWREASERAEDPADLLRIGFQLARRGVTAASLLQLASAHRDEVEELRLLARLNSGTPGELETLRGTARTSRVLTLGLITYLERCGEHLQAAQAAADGAAQWGDAELWLIAARQYLRAESYDSSVEAARAAIARGRPEWSDGLTAHLVLLEALTSVNRWSEAADASASAMTRYPTQPGAVWALVLCQLHLGRKQDAWATYADFGGRPEPRTEHEAAVRVRLWREFEASEPTVSEMLALVDRWPESREVQLAAAYALLFLPLELQDSMRAIVSARIGQLFTDLPDVFVQQEFDDDDVVGSLNRMVAGLPDTSELDRQVLTGMLPFGMVASIHHRSLTEVLVCRTGALFAHNAARFEAEVMSAQAARAGSVVADVSALVTLTYFDEALAIQLSGFAQAVRAPLRQRLDAASAVDSLAHLSTLTVGRSSDGTATVNFISEEEAVARHRRATSVFTRFDSLLCIERTWEPRVPELGDRLDDFLWAESLDLALEDAPNSLWADDARTRELSVGVGVPAFSTSALIEAMRREGVLLDAVAMHLQAVLITRHFVGADFNPVWAQAAANLDSWAPRGVASYVAWGSPNGDAGARMRFVLDALERNIGDPAALQAWVETIAHWLVRAGGDDANSNLVVLVQTLLSREWMTAAQLPFILAGVRAVTAGRDLSDPFELALQLHYRVLTSTIEPRFASAIITGLVSLAPEQDRSTATRVIFTAT